METSGYSPVFDSGPAAYANRHLLPASRWAYCLSLFGMSVSGLVLLMVGVEMFGDVFRHGSLFGDINLGLACMFWLAIAGVFYACLLLYKFSSAMRRAIIANDHSLYYASCRYLKLFFKCTGIVVAASIVVAAAVFILMITGVLG